MHYLKRMIYLLPALACMIMIFSFSAKTAERSGQESSAIVEFIMNNVIPGAGEWDADKWAQVSDVLEVLIRKAAHATEFAVLEILLGLGLLKGRFFSTINRGLVASVCVSFLYACSDEIHQLFVPGRSGQVTDVLIDMIGVLTAAAVAFIFVAPKNKGADDETGNYF